MSNSSEDLYNAMASFVGNTLSIFSFLSLIAGIAYIVWGEFEKLKLKRSQINESYLTGDYREEYVLHRVWEVMNCF